jgi:hypothetical protein
MEDDLNSIFEMEEDLDLISEIEDNLKLFQKLEMTSNFYKTSNIRQVVRLTKDLCYVGRFDPENIKVIYNSRKLTSDL